jgi:hypothetical protein
MYAASRPSSKPVPFRCRDERPVTAERDSARAPELVHEANDRIKGDLGEHVKRLDPQVERCREAAPDPHLLDVELGQRAPRRPRVHPFKLVSRVVQPLRKDLLIVSCRDLEEIERTRDVADRSEQDVRLVTSARRAEDDVNKRVAAIRHG